MNYGQLKEKIRNYLVKDRNYFDPVEFKYVGRDYIIASYIDRDPVTGEKTSDIFYMIFDINTGECALDIAYYDYSMAKEVVDSGAVTEENSDRILEAYNLRAREENSKNEIHSRYR